MLLKDQVAVITGGSSGIGRAAALLFAKEGAALAILDRSPEGKEVSSEIERNGGSCLFIQTDVRSRQALTAAVEDIVDRFGRIDVLFSNAGINPRLGKIEDTTDEQWNEVIETNLRSCFDVIKAVIPHMVARRYGSIIATSSISGRVWAADHSVPYGVSKTGIEAIIKSVAAQYGPVGIRSNCVLPGFIETPLNWVKDPDVKERIINRIPLRRAGTPEDVAKVALFLASDLSSYVNGESIIVDGGFTLYLGARSTYAAMAHLSCGLFALAAEVWRPITWIAILPLAIGICPIGAAVVQFVRGFQAICVYQCETGAALCQPT